MNQHQPFAKYFVLIVMMGISHLAQAQIDTIYLDSNYYRITPVEAVQLKVEKTEGGLFIIEFFQKEPFQLLSRRAFTDEFMKEKAGTWSFYYDNGQLECQYSYKNGEKDGAYLCHYESGQLKNQGLYLKGKSEGEWEYYYENGQLEKKGAFRQSEMHGPWLYYYEDGQLKRDIHFDKGVGVDSVKSYFPDGRLKSIGTFIRGKLNLAQAYDSTANALLVDGEGEWLSYKGDGTAFQQGKFQKGFREGKWKIFLDEEGWRNLLNKGEYPQARLQFTQGLLVGKVKIFDKSGKLVHAILANDFDASKLDYWANDVFLEVEPVPLNMADIRQEIGYPNLARDAGISGQVIFRVLVGKDGKLLEYKIIKDAHPILRQAVEKEIMNLRFSPGIIKSKATKFWVNIPFSFKLID
jgi:TonB family protein